MASATGGGGKRAVLIMVLFCLGCQPDPGEVPEYDIVPQYFPDPNEKWIEGPTPCRQGEKRLSIGVFYDGCPANSATVETIVLDGSNAEFFPYIVNEGQNNQLQSTCAIGRYWDDVREGRWATRIAYRDAALFWGAMVHLKKETFIDLSEYDKLYLSLKSEDDAFDNFAVRMANGYDVVGDQNSGGIIADVVDLAVTDYAYKNDGQWHDLEIPLKDFEDKAQAIKKDFTLSAVTRIGLLNSGASGKKGDFVLVDNFFIM